ncbi:MAG: hypothetical protein ACOH5I_00450 [Oligoflexus sp.]
MKKMTTYQTFLVLVVLIWAKKSFADEQEICKPFRIHMHAEQPKLPIKLTAAELKNLNIDQMLTAISKVPYHSSYRQIFNKAREEKLIRFSDQQMKSFLYCIHHYVSQDTDQDGTPDWIAITSQQITNILIPLDPDINGNGVNNIFDPNPFYYHQTIPPASHQEIPPHLKMADDETTKNQNGSDQQVNRAALQEKLWHKYGIMAVDHTDQHAATVLEELFIMLENSLTHFRNRDIQSHLVLYAFKGHDATRNIAAYHQEARAISIGGIATYGKNSLRPSRRANLLASLAHELGHDFIFSHLNAIKLKEVGEKFGGWIIPFESASNSLDLYDPAFLLPYHKDDKAVISLIEDSTITHEFNFASQYAFTNVHEWFADAFAGWVLQKLGHKGLLGEDWADNLVYNPRKSNEYWVNYQNISNPFVKWMDNKIVSLD